MSLCQKNKFCLPINFGKSKSHRSRGKPLSCEFLPIYSNNQYQVQRPDEIQPDFAIFEKKTKRIMLIPTMKRPLHLVAGVAATSLVLSCGGSEARLYEEVQTTLADPLPQHISQPQHERPIPSRLQSILMTTFKPDRMWTISIDRFRQSTHRGHGRSVWV